jgi:hypothetical protein
MRSVGAHHTSRYEGALDQVHARCTLCMHTEVETQARLSPQVGRHCWHDGGAIGEVWIEHSGTARSFDEEGSARQTVGMISKVEGESW